MKRTKADNELIAEFMGISFDESGQCTDPERKYCWRPGCYDPLRVEHLQYDTSWNWLMPAVEKIDSMMPAINIPDDLGSLRDGTHLSDRYMEVAALPIATPMPEVYTAVVAFIKWYNQQQP